LEKHLLSKSTFIRGWQCLKSLYLYKNFIHLRDPLSAERQAVFSRGSNVGILARRLFPRGKDATVPKKYAAQVERTKQLMDAGLDVIYEAAFQAGQVLAVMDIVVKKDGKWYAYEVKSSSRVTSAYMLDAALQYYVITNSGIQLQDISIVHINSQYLRDGDIELDKLFTIVSVKDDAIRAQPLVAERIESAKDVLLNMSGPDVQIGEHCFSPYLCDFKGHCWSHIPKDSVFDIAGISRQQQFEMYNAGIVRIKDVPKTYSLEKPVRMHVDSFADGKPVVNKEGLQKFLTKLSYPLYFLDFETFMPAVPLYDKTKPYQHIPFQYSLHYKETKESVAKHKFFLAEAGLDPRREFLERLLKDTEAPGPILVYDDLMERSVFNGLAADFPVYAGEIKERLSRIIDLAVPFQQRLYYHPSMKGSYSIKNVLPALVPGLRYEQLAISSGNVAMTAYEQLQRESDLFVIAETRDALLEYSRMDTLAMVKLLEVLEGAVT
jgi:predicted RecB family nuclease